MPDELNPVAVVLLEYTRTVVSFAPDIEAMVSVVVMLTSWLRLCTPENSRTSGIFCCCAPITATLGQEEVVMETDETNMVDHNAIDN